MNEKVHIILTVDVTSVTVTVIWIFFLVGDHGFCT